MADHGSSVEKSKKLPRRLSFACVLCNSNSEAPPNTHRAENKLCRICFGKGKDKRPKDLNDLSGAEWARYSKSVESYPDTRTGKQRFHGACFPKSLALQQIEIFTKRGQTVFDPFVGVGTTLDAAMELGRNGIGIDLNSDFVELAKESVKEAAALGVSQNIYLDDAQNLEKYIKPESVDFILTSPPYATLLKSIKGNFAYKWREHSTLNPVNNPNPYSSDTADLGNMSYQDFLGAIKKIMRATLNVLRQDGYAVWIVKDYRDIKNKIPYVNFHGDVATVATEAGFTLWDIRIYDQTKFRPLVCLGYPSKNFYLNIGHSYLLTFKKS